MNFGGERAGRDGHKRKKGSKVHLAVDTLGQLLGLLMTPANAQDRAQVAALAAAGQDPAALLRAGSQVGGGPGGYPTIPWGFTAATGTFTGMCLGIGPQSTGSC